MTRILRGWVLTFAVAGVIALLPQIAAAQNTQAPQYKQASGVITDSRQLRQLEKEVRAIQRSAQRSDADVQKLASYYKHYIAGMTHPAAANTPSRFPGMRRQILRDLSELGTSPSDNQVRTLVFRGAEHLVKGTEYSPLARYNALLLLGELNDQEGGGRPFRPPVPMANARRVLLEIFNGNESQEMKVGALIGLARHARLIAAAGGQPPRELLDVFVGVLRQEEPAGDGTPDGLMWMKRIAVDALGDIGQPGAASLLQPIVNDTSAPLMLRCAAANSLARLNYQQGQAPMDLAEVVKGIGQLATQVVGQQLTTVTEHITTDVGVTRSAPPAEASGEGGSTRRPEDPFVLRIRRELKYPLKSASDALTSLEKIAADPDKRKITAVRSAVDALLKQVDTEQLTPQTLLDGLSRPAGQLEAAVNAL